MIGLIIGLWVMLYYNSQVTYKIFSLNEDLTVTEVHKAQESSFLVIIFYLVGFLVLLS